MWLKKGGKKGSERAGVGYFDISFQGLSDTQQTVFPPKPEVDLVD